MPKLCSACGRRSCRETAVYLLATLAVAALLNRLCTCSVGDNASMLGGSLFSGMMAMAGFLFTARSFLVLNLEKEVYGKKAYRDWQAKLSREDGKSSPDPYVPFEEFDRKLGRTIWWCVSAICVLWLAALVPATQAPHAHRALADLAVAFVLSTIIQVACSVRSMNRNFRSIIRFWSQHQRDEKAAL